MSMLMPGLHQRKVGQMRSPGFSCHANRPPSTHVGHFWHREARHAVAELPSRHCALPRRAMPIKAGVQAGQVHRCHCSSVVGSYQQWADPLCSSVALDALCKTVRIGLEGCRALSPQSLLLCKGTHASSELLFQCDCAA